ncbi:MAG: hypothetical protein WDN23_17605 [Edaphobacter sp.]
MRPMWYMMAKKAETEDDCGEDGEGKDSERAAGCAEWAEDEREPSAEWPRGW